jgi:hypothetical protein
MTKKHTGSTSIPDFMGWDNGKWKSRPIRIFRNVALSVIVLLIGGLIGTGFMRCDLHTYFC